MTAPRAARTNSYGQRFYPVPRPDTKELVDLPSWTRLSKLLAAPGLETWKQKNVARQVALRPDLQMLAAEDETVYQAVKQALDASMDKANVGTGIHRYCELADKGILDLDMVPTAAKPHLEAYTTKRDEVGWKLVEAEVTVYSFELGAAGTADRFVDYPGLGIVAADLKTGESVYPEVALQLGLYANAEGIWTAPADEQLEDFSAAKTALEQSIAQGINVPKGRRKWSEAAIKEARANLDECYWEEFAQFDGHRPMPEGLRTDVAIVFHLRADACVPVLVRLDTEVPATEVIRSLRTIYGWQAIDKTVIGSLEGPVTSRADDQATGSEAIAGPVADSEDGDGKAVLPFLPQTEPESPALSAAVPALEERRAYLKARLAHTAKESKRAIEYIATIWPDGLPMLKDCKFPEQLDRIEALIDRADAHHQVPFENLDQATEAILDAFPGAEVVDDPTEAERMRLAKQVEQLVKTEPERVAVLMEDLRGLGLAKSLRSAPWTAKELTALKNAIARSGKATTTTKEKQHAA